MQIKKCFFWSLLFIISSLKLSAQYNPYWQWARADTVNKLTIGNGGSVLAVKNGKAFWARMSKVSQVVNNVAQGSWYISETDSTGRQLNVSAILGKVQLIDAQADAAGNWYVLGRFYDSAIFASGGTLIRLNPATNTDGDHFIARFNASTLIVQWARIVGPFVDVSSRAITLDNNKLYVAADSFGGTSIRSMSFATGDVLGSFFQSGFSTTSSIQVDSKGGIYLAGSCATLGINFNGATEAATSPDRYSYIVKYHSNGTHAWHYWMPDPLCFQRRLYLYKDNFLYYSGNLKDSFNLGAIPVGPPFNNGFDYMAARLDSTGKIFWVKQNDTAGGGHASPGDPYHSIVTPDSALVLFMQGNGYLNWGDTVATDLTAFHAATLVSFGPDRTARWARPIITDISSNQHIATEGTAVWVTGNAWSQSATVAFDTLTLRVSARNYTPFLAKTKMIRPIPVNPPPGGVNPASTNSISIYPIPAHNILEVTALPEIANLELYSMEGRLVSSWICQPGSKTIVDVSSLPRGTYTLSLYSEHMQFNRKLLLQ